eukprot:scaffold8139_cov363-Prasinococcus_capsulatus_cf.AAC.2
MGNGSPSKYKDGIAGKHLPGLGRETTSYIPYAVFLFFVLALFAGALNMFHITASGSEPSLADGLPKHAQSAIAEEEGVESKFGGKYYPSSARLDLSGLGLAEIPQGVFKMTNLRELDLARNALKAIPSDIGNLTGLRKYARCCSCV